MLRGLNMPTGGNMLPLRRPFWFGSDGVKFGRYTWRRDSVHLSQVGNVTVYADVPGFLNPSTLFESARPDIVFVKDNTYHIIELTICFESNLVKSHEYKRRMHECIQDYVIDKNFDVVLYPGI
ncbi:uncharacterized protein LOC130623830 [Hydractinia symbiolongicarpus]|uniref:uncharacterized protein LOC130623830 n=1 Tax=Hydractinia symbiolongicarpus TaxID=13093 RepID=UPI00254D44E3|nr:uncharacterized protein LOC130623830 [Hydractinia symbiolongicarpus]